MKKINEYDKFLNERFFAPNITKERLQELISKAKTLIPEDKIKSFISENEEEIQKVSDLITDENGEIDYNKVKQLIKSKSK